MKYSIKEAVKKLIEAKREKFDATVEMHINLNTDPKKQDQQIRFTTILPAGTGKSKKVAVMASEKVPNADLELTENDIKKIEDGNLKIGRDFDLIVTEPQFMAKLAKAARILGPAGVMPNPKTGTVTDNVEKAVEQIKKGKIEVKTEQNHPIIHTIVGKTTFKDADLEKNINELVSVLKQHKPSKIKGEFIKSAFISSSMGPSFKLEV